MTPAEYRVLQLCRAWQEGGQSIRAFRDLVAAIYDLPPDPGSIHSGPLPEVSAANYAADLARGHLVRNKIQGVKVAVTISPKVRQRLNEAVIERYAAGMKPIEIAQELSVTGYVVNGILYRHRRAMKSSDTLDLFDSAASGVPEEAKPKHVPQDIRDSGEPSL